MSSESGRFSFRQECEVSMWLFADGPVSLSDGVYTGPSLFWLGKSKVFMLWSRNNETRVCSTRRYWLVGRGKIEKTHCCYP